MTRSQLLDFTPLCFSPLCFSPLDFPPLCLAPLRSALSHSQTALTHLQAVPDLLLHVKPVLSHLSGPETSLDAASDAIQQYMDLLDVSGCEGGVGAIVGLRAIGQAAVDSGATWRPGGERSVTREEGWG